MDTRTYVEIEAWGDFDVRYTKCIMVADGLRDVDYLTKAFCHKNGLPGTEGLSYNMINDANEEFVKFLRKEGFRELKTSKVCFSD